MLKIYKLIIKLNDGELMEWEKNKNYTAKGKLRVLCKYNRYAIIYICLIEQLYTENDQEANE